MRAAPESKVEKADISKRAPTGVPGLDKLIEGGLVRGSTYIIAGQAGTGKSILAMQTMLHGVDNGEPGVYATLEQTVDEIVEDMAKFGWDQKIRKYIQEGKLAIISTVPTSIKDLQDLVLTHAKRIGAKRFILDSLSVATVSWKVSSMDIGKVRAEIFDFMRMLENASLTSILITEVPEAEEKKISRFGFEEFIADGVIVLRYSSLGQVGTRTLEVRKMRRTKMDESIHTLKFTPEGIKIE